MDLHATEWRLFDPKAKPDLVIQHIDYSQSINQFQISWSQRIRLMYKAHLSTESIHFSISFLYSILSISMEKSVDL